MPFQLRLNPFNSIAAKLQRTKKDIDGHKKSFIHLPFQSALCIMSLGHNNIMKYYKYTLYINRY